MSFAAAARLTSLEDKSGRPTPPLRGRLLVLGALTCSVLGATSCIAAAPENDGGVSEMLTETDDSSPSPDDQSTSACNLNEANDNPLVTLSGRLCGETFSLATRAGAIVHLGRSQATDPETEVRVIEVLESADPGTPADLTSAEFLVNLAFETGPEVASAVSTHNLVSGVFSLCGFGTVVMQSGPVTFEMSGVDDGATSGDFTLTLTGLLVGGYSAQHGQSRVQACGGEVDLTLQGRFVHQ